MIDIINFSKVKANAQLLLQKKFQTIVYFIVNIEHSVSV